LNNYSFLPLVYYSFFQGIIFLKKISSKNKHYYTLFTTHSLKQYLPANMHKMWVIISKKIKFW